MKQLVKTAKKYLRVLRDQPAKLKSAARINYPELLGFETSKPMVRFYRNDSVFKTLVSFNHFIEVFTEYQNLNIEVYVQAYNRSGTALHSETFTLDRGAKQFFLHELIMGLDSFGMFTLSFRLRPNYVKELSFLQKVSCQFMTVYVPQDEISAPQMIHSHKELQGPILISRELQRRSNSIESLKDLTELQFYFINPSASSVEMEFIGFQAENNKVQVQKHFLAQPYSCVKVELSAKKFLNTETMGFIFKFNKNINHKKPIVFRKFNSQIWSCNHT